MSGFSDSEYYTTSEDEFYQDSEIKNKKKNVVPAIGVSRPSISQALKNTTNVIKARFGIKNGGKNNIFTLAKNAKQNEKQLWEPGCVDDNEVMKKRQSRKIARKSQMGRGSQVSMTSNQSRISNLPRGRMSKRHQHLIKQYQDGQAPTTLGTSTTVLPKKSTSSIRNFGKQIFAGKSWKAALIHNATKSNDVVEYKRNEAEYSTRVSNANGFRSSTMSSFGRQSEMNDGRKMSMMSKVAAVARRSTMVRDSDQITQLLGSDLRAEMENERLTELYKKRFVIHPFSNLKIYLDLISFVFVLWSVFMIPVILSFYTNNDQSWTIYQIIWDIWFMIDIIIQFNTGYTEEGIESEVILDHDKIRKNYMKGWFALDFVSMLSFDVLFSLVSFGAMKMFNTSNVTSSATNYADFAKVAKILRLASILRIFRLGRMYRMINQWEGLVSFTYDNFVQIFKLIKTVMIMFIFLHIISCILYNPKAWFFLYFIFVDEDFCSCSYEVNNFTCPAVNLTSGETITLDNVYPVDSWVRLKKIPVEAHPGCGVDFLIGTECMPVKEKYAWSFYISLSHMLCIGYGQFPPQTVCEAMWTIFSMFVGSVLWAVFIGSLTSYQETLDQDNSNFKEKQVQVEEWMNFRRLPQKLRQQVFTYLEIKFRGNLFSEHDILKELNPLLKKEVMKFNCMKLLRSVFLFHDVSDEFAMDLIAKMTFEIHTDGDRIIREGNQARRMFMVSKGSARIKSATYQLEQVVRKGSSFGEAGLLAPFSKRPCDVIAEEVCEVYAIATEDFVEVAVEYPDDMKKILGKASEVFLKRKHGRTHVKKGRKTK